MREAAQAPSPRQSAGRIPGKAGEIGATDKAGAACNPLIGEPL